MNAFRTNLQNREFFWAFMCLLAIFFGLGILGWMILAGGNPLTINNVGVFDGAEQARSAFKAGDLAVIHRKACSTRDQAMVNYPALRNERGVIFPLPVSMTQIETGCAETGYGFAVPPLPPGEYTFVNRISFQNNLIGRNESATYPLLSLWITQ